MKRPSSLNTLRTFEVAARKLSFKEAGEELSLSASAVSRQINQLETEINCPLFERFNRQLALTKQGAQLYTAVNEALRSLEKTIQLISPDLSTAELRISAQPYFVHHWLLPRLQQFNEEYPHINLSFESEHTYQPFNAQYYDGCFRFEAEPSEEADCFHLFKQYAVPVASPSLLRAIEWGGDLSELNQLRWFYTASQPQLWDQWKQLHGLSSLNPKEISEFDDAEMALQAAKKGLGIVMAAWPLIDDDIASGDLVMLSEKHEALAADYYFLYAKNSNNPNLSVFVNWLQRSLAN